MHFSQDNLTVACFPSREEMGRQAAADVAARIHCLLRQQDQVNLIFAAAPSQNEFLAALAADDSIDWTRLNAFHMDEYIGLPADAPQRFGRFLHDRLFAKVPFHQVFYLNPPEANDPAEECRRYTDLLKQYPTDIVCLGIGENGHIAFNDPHVARFDDPQRVKIVDLDPQCRLQQVHDGCFSSLNEVPTHAMTLTIPALTAAKSLYCIVPSWTKAPAIKRTLQGPISPECPASILRRHPSARLYLDADSASLLS